MSTPLNKPLGGGRPLGAGSAPGLRGPSLAPLTPGGKSDRRRAWLVWLIGAPVALLAFTYLMGRTVEPVRAQVENIPAVGKPLFAQPVWPILWNQPTKAKEPAKPAVTSGGSKTTAVPSGGTAPSSGTASEMQTLMDQAAARLAAAEAKEADLKEREAAVRVKQLETGQLQLQMAQAVKETEALKLQLAAQLRAEQDKVAVFQGMSRTGQEQLLGVMTDDEVVTILKYLPARDVGKALEKLDPWRAARLWARLPKVAATP